MAKNTSTWPACANARLSSAAVGDVAATALARSPMRGRGRLDALGVEVDEHRVLGPALHAAFAIASPIPPAAPVTTIRFPLRFMTGQPYYRKWRGLSVLDQSPIPEGATSADALANTLDLARLADELGYHRYWLAEHHGGPMLAGSAPEALIGADRGGDRRGSASAAAA